MELFATSPALAATSPLQSRLAAVGRGVTETEIRFGMSAPFSGSAKELGRQMKLGVESAFNVINDAGGSASKANPSVPVDVVTYP